MAKRQAQPSLLNFFAKAQKTSNSVDSIQSTTCSPEVTNTTTSIIHGRSIEAEEESEFHPFDVGKYVNKRVDESLKFQLLTSAWVPGNSFKFPTSGKRNLRFQSQWLTRFPWLVYTRSDGALCKYCVLFSKDCTGKGSHQALKSLVKEPYKKWKDALETFKGHEANSYHKQAMITGSDFLKTKKDQSLDIRNFVDSGRKKQAEENRQKLASIVDIIKLCGRQELALRGTNDSGPICIKDEEPVVNGDKNLLKHTENAALNASYMSPKIQNELISICGEIVQKQIVKNVNDADAFSILVDETADIAGQEQMSICVRYTIKLDNLFICKEDFLCFVKVESTTGQDLADTITTTLQQLGIDLNNMIGQGYDGAAAMKGSFKGVQAVVRKNYPQALYVHCSSHSLNLALCHSCNVSSVRNCIGTVKTIANFLKASPKRTSALQACLRSNFPESRWKTLTPMCETRWVENHNSLLKFKEMFKAIAETLENLCQSTDIDTASKACSFLKAILSGEFIVCLCFLANIFSATITLCKVLQSPLCDLKSAVDHVENVVEYFENIRSRIDDEFSKTFKSAKVLLNDVEEEIRIPRLSAVQRRRSNIPTHDPESYFRVTVAIPLLDDLISQLKSRFCDHKEVLCTLSDLIPSVCPGKSLDMDSLKLYESKVELELIQSEFEMWKIYWEKKCEVDKPSCAIEALGECNSELFPNIFKLLKILSSLPVTTCNAERTFSTLRRLKTYLRNSCRQDRLTGLALMSVHSDINISTEEVISKFAMKKERKLDFVL